ncbi:MAG: hypothetical protein IT293_22165 [Deltaproteobacteria bacterium]|nr:hypothetical protein [Deltaproteobacteria bacterium]
MSVAPALLVFLVLHGIFFADVVFDGRSLSAASSTAGLTARGPLDAPDPAPPPHLLDVEGAAWVDEPSPYLARAGFAAGELPLWSPGSGLGSPLAANLNSGAGNPLQLPLNLWPSPTHADLFYLARLLLLACATWAFLREIRLASAAACLGAALVAYGGYPLGWIAHHPLSTEVFLPLMLLGFERGRAGRVGGWTLLAFAAAGSVLGGKLQASLLCVAFTTAWALVRAPRRRGGRGIATLASTAAGLVLAAGLAGFLLVPALESMARASGLTLGGRSQLAGFVVPWPSLASLAVPALFVAPGRAFADGLLTPSLGGAAVVLGALGVAARAAPMRHGALCCAAWAVALLARNVGAFGDLAVHLPVLRGILFVKYTFTVVFAVAVAAAIGFDALLAGRCEDRSARRAILVAWLALAALAGAAVWRAPLPTHAAALALPGILSLALGAAVGFWWGGRVGRGLAAWVLAAIALVELWAAAPHRHPPRLDPYRAPPYVAFLRGAEAGRIVADPDLAVPLTSVAAGLADVRSIDVLTPGATYAFFTRLLSFCGRVIHFTVDPDVPLAATAPAADLAGVRWVVTRRPLVVDDLAIRVRRQVGRERTARLLAGLTRLAVVGGPLAIGPIAAAGEERFAFSVPTPFTLDVTAVTEAGELAFGALVRGAASAVEVRTVVDGVASDASGAPRRLGTGEAWQEERVALGRAGEARRVRVRVTAASVDGAPAVVALGDLGFGPGAAVEARLGAERGTRHAAEAAALREAFRDPLVGAVVYENANALPRAFRVRNVEPTASEEAALGRLGDGFDFRTTALVPKADAAALSAALAVRTAPAAGADDDSGTAIERETPGSVTVATAGPAPALLVLADLAYPGWRADVDGRAATVHTVDGVLRGVLVPAGRHVVTFRYRPTSWIVGGALSLLAAALLVPYARIGARLHAEREAA